MEHHLNVEKIEKGIEEQFAKELQVIKDNRKREPVSEEKKLDDY